MTHLKFIRSIIQLKSFNFHSLVFLKMKMTYKTPILHHVYSEE